MRSRLKALLGLFLILALAALCSGAGAQDREPRLALVIGNANYKEAPLATPLNDAGLLAQTLKDAGFDVTAGADLDQKALRRALRDFLAKAQQAGPNSVVFVYLAGRGLQYAGENYFVPVDALVQREADVARANVRLTDFTHALAAIPAKARIFVLDGARALHFATEGHPFASGLALVDPEPGCLYAFNTAPGTIAPNELGPYGFYAGSLVEMLREGASLDQVFADTRLRVSELSDGTMVPWDAAKIDAPIFLFARQAAPLANFARQESEPLSGLPVQVAYTLAIERDTLAGYEDFLAAYAGDPLAPRVRALLAVRREALTWQRAVEANRPQAYWTYLSRYPRGAHFADVLRRLTLLGAPLRAPERFELYDFDGLPPPSEEEEAVADRTVPIFDNPSSPPPPSAPDFILPPRPAVFEDLPPPAMAASGSLPVPPRFSTPATKEPTTLVTPNVSQNQAGTQPQGEHKPPQ
jgi:uncharacterized caspase-like protein